MKNTILIGFSLTLSSFLIIGCSDIDSYIQDYPDDNIVEELIEEIIESKLGVEIDLTTFSREE